MRNTWVICREDWDNLLKGELIPDVEIGRHLLISEAGDPALSGFGEHWSVFSVSRKCWAWRFAISPRPIS